VTERSSHQREVNNLLQRRPSWTDDDVLRFTALIRQDHLNEQEELHAKEASQVADAEVEREFNELMRSILSRYHEEQIWSDKIRSASTYGSLAALGLNLVVFILAIVLVEPWKRKRLAQTFEKRIEELSKETRAMIEGALLDLNSEFSLQRGLLEGLTIGSVTRGVGSGESSQIRSDIGENEISAVQSTDGRRLDNPAILLFGGAIAGGLMTWISSRMI
jgi:sensitive to high expression protein 9